MSMLMQDVESSNIAQIGFDGEAIRVTFRGGRTYDYTGGENVDMAALFSDFATADSHGRFFANEIKGRLHSTKVGSD